ncbi:nuclear transport factor 2 family protein [Streptomyces sp. NPDC127098]|uniref:nuclear transport factor 2 family protein n=1 Tax=Streptomyces sp. NPDC127098 TaxID=3347137 RepID=UPI003659B8C2
MSATTIAALADRTEIAELFARLTRLLDEGRYDDAHTVYTDDVVVHSPRGGVLRGLPEVTAHLHRQHPEGEHTHHLHGDVQVTLEVDRATATANQLAFFYRDGEPPYQEAGTRLTYGAVRTPAGWRFDEADIALTFLRPLN